MLECRDLTAGYGGGVVLEGLSLAVGRGEAVGVLGRNGVGKTTLLRVIMGLLPLAGGEVRLDGLPIHRVPTHARARAGLAYVPQGRGLFGELSVADNLRLADLARPGIDDALGLFSTLAERRDARADALSGGQQQQLAIARALRTRPTCLLLDEPSEGVQPSVVSDLADTLRARVAETGLAVVLVEQNADLALRLCDRLVFLEAGAVAETIPAEAARRDPALIDARLGL
ncbi:MAG: ABC transporter ATP-binding protein [Azospirillaceae bacterium]